ncbi:S-layer homology domain-containing protein [Capilliphycus salinus ALCB114379]|uniref:S-layer homology domain-containing protein n=1 Tax=Capilliphycus salinus TaxID=2768948 RepID=UPI0039A729C8
MSHSIPPNSSPQGSSRNNDEWIAVLVALVALGGIFFWILGKDAKPDKQKFATPPVVPVPERTASDDLNLSRVLEDSFARYRGQEVGERVAIPRTSNRNLFQVFSADDRTIADSDSRGVDRPLAFTPFFFAPPDTAGSAENVGSPVTIAPVPTLDPTETEPETETTPQQAAQSETEETPQPQPQAAQSETEETPQPQPQAAQSETETTVVPIIPPQEPTATEPETQASPQPQQQAAQSETQTPEAPVPLVLADVPEDFWARDFIEYTTQNDIIVPYANGTFKPTQPITRAEFAALVENAFIPEQSKSGQPSYKDVDQSYWGRTGDR